MTSITPAHAHAYQATRHMPAILVKISVYQSPKPDVRILPILATRERGNDFRGWDINTNGCTRVVIGETFAGWNAWKNCEVAFFFLVCVHL